MNESKPRLPHLAFFEALASSPDEASAEWRTTKAGLVTLRMFDNWADMGADVITENNWGVHAVRRTIMQIDAGNPLRALILNVLEGMRAVPDAPAAEVVPQLFAYARGLEFDAQWALAADVYQTIISHARAIADAHVVVSAHMYMGACLRVLTHWREATEAYKIAGRLAKAIGDQESVIRSEIATAKLAIDRGNLPKAEKILDRAIAHAERADQEEIRAVALHDRAAVAYHRQQYELAVHLNYQALSGIKDESERDRVLGDIASSFFELGLKDVARDAHLVIAATTQQQHTRWVSTVNLLEIAATDGNEAVFEQYRRQLASAALPASLAVHYHYYVGQGYRAFGKLDSATQALEQAIRIAGEHNLNEVLIKAEQSLEDIRQGRELRVACESTVPPAAETSAMVAAAATAIREMRALVAAAV